MGSLLKYLKQGRQRSTYILRTSLVVALIGVVITPATWVASVAADPAINEYPTTGQTPINVVNGPDGALWMSEFNDSKIVRMTPSGVETDYPVSDHSYGITVGPDGNIWYTLPDGNTVAKMTTSGAVTQYPLPPNTADPDVGGRSPHNITVGPDGNMWFTEVYTNTIDRMTTDGTLTEFPLPGENYGLDGITSGPDGAIWFTTGAGVGRITTDGDITLYPVTNGGAGIISGPDGNLWFAGTYNNTISSMDTNGTITGQYTVPTANSEPEHLTVGYDGAVWFTEAASNKIGRVTASGAFSEYQVPSANAGPLGIASGPDRNLWFTETGTGKLGQLVLIAAPWVHMSHLPANTTITGTRQLVGVVTSSLNFNAMLYVFNSSGQAVVAKYWYNLPASPAYSVSYSWDSTTVPNGAYTVIFSAKDSAGHKDEHSTVSVKVNVQN